MCGYLLEPVDDLSDGVEVADVPTSLQQAKNTRQNCLTIIVTGLIDNDVRHPRTYLQHRHITVIVIYIIKGDMFVCLFRIAGQTAGPIETKLDTRTHVHPGSVTGKVNVKVIHVCLRE